MFSENAIQRNGSQDFGCFCYFFIDKNVGFFGGYGLVLGGGCFVFTIFLNKLSSDVCF